MQNIQSQTMTFILAGGRGERLSPLTDFRSKPAVPFGDRHIIDFTLANSLKSSLAHPFIVTQYQAAHLTQHVGQWQLRQPALAARTVAPVCLPAPERPYKGTADALFRNLDLLTRDTRHVVVLSADHIYDMDYRELLRVHMSREADATIAAIVYPSGSSKQFGILEVDAHGRVVGFEEKPSHPKELPGHPGHVLANMGIYVFRSKVFVDALRRDAYVLESQHDLGRNILPRLVAERVVNAFRFEGYWKDVGTIDSYYDATMEWAGSSGSVIASNVRVHPSATVIDSILLPGVNIGPRAQVRRAILDENVLVLPGAEIGYGTTGHNFKQTSNGVVVVPANSVVNAETRRTRVRLGNAVAAHA